MKSQPRTKILVGCDAALFAWQVFTDLLKTAVYSPLSKYRSRIRPSYTKPPHEVFCDVARVTIEDDHSLRPVALARNLASRSPVTPLPSWVPDWTGAEFLIPMHLHQEGNHGTEIKLDIPRNAHFSANGLILSVRGTICDVVSALQSAWALQYQQEPDQFCNTIRDIFLSNGFSLMSSVVFNKRIFSQ